jgi:NADPH:quinone reductase-like Zn-dependent oxidoreductase
VIEMTTTKAVIGTRVGETAGTMRAMTSDRYGSADVLRLGTVDVPTVRDGEVLVRVHAAGVDRGTWHLLTGRPYIMRLMGFGLRRPAARVPGLDLAGTVVAVGPGVTQFAPGDEVFGIGGGSFAEYAVAKEAKLARKPASIGFEQAAVMPVSGMTALQGLRDAGKLQPGQHVLVLGASGGVGSYAVQVAKAMGAEVTGVASTAKLDLVRALGADHVIDYTRQDPTDGTVRYDLILDTGGRTPLRRLRRALTERGTLVIVGGEGGGRVTGGFDRQIRAMLWSTFVSQRLTALVSSERGTDLEHLAGLVDAGSVRPSVDRTYPLAGVPEAIRRLEAGEVRGKVAITI